MTRRFEIGPFKFTVRGDRIWWRYRVTHFGVRVRASGETSHSLGGRVVCFMESDSEYAVEGLVPFVRYFMADIPGAIHWAEHYTRVRRMEIRALKTEVAA